MCSAVSLYSYPSPLASALLHFENQMKEKKQAALFKTTEKTSPEDKIRSDPEELNLLWMGSQLPCVALDALFRPMPPRLPQGNRLKGGDEACQCVHPHPDWPGRHRGTVAWTPGAGCLLLHRNNSHALSHQITSLVPFCVDCTKVWEIKGTVPKANSTFF